MILSLARFELQFPGSRSLKDKRHVLKGLLDSLRDRLNVSALEVEYADKWQRSIIAVAWVSYDGAGAEQCFGEIARRIETKGDLLVCGVVRSQY